MDQELLKRLSIEDLVGEEASEKVENGIAILRKLQKTLYEMADLDDDDALTKIKIGTTLTFEVLKRFYAGKSPQQYTKEDWAQVAETVTHLSIEMDGGEYSTYIFGLYANYISWSASLFHGRIPEEKAAAIAALADELTAKAKLFREGKIAETVYTEECLWICLEAMIKLLSSLVYLVPFRDFAEATEAAAAFAFEYGRLMLYKKEQALLNGYLQNQRQLDAELQEKFEAFKAELQTGMDQFDGFVKNAFSSDIRTSLQGSIALARAAGVDETDILKTVEDVDDFFM